eukprot:TRINITY_DN7899_c0_g1_i1.p1 TRINITY_DN7899_c0_g1~~TRINITY_DN7899_c0_g1_i1.p1  ORF type:complete len:222 (+),score=79.73 TRINITY_DN7899_c0_g1_i1:957-1622(+)
MSKNSNLTHFVTKCIRQDKLESKTVSVEGFGASEVDPLRIEHFVELSVVIKFHEEVYGEIPFKVAVGELLQLRKHFNAQGNLYWINDSINLEKQNATQFFLKGGKSRDNPISTLLHKYVNAVGQDVLKHIELFHQDAKNDKIRRMFKDYVNWLLDCPKDDKIVLPLPRSRSPSPRKRRASFGRSVSPSPSSPHSPGDKHPNHHHHSHSPSPSTLAPPHDNR